jgi:hypothetical protein
MPRVLVVANRTVAGRRLLEAVRERAEGGDTTFHLCVPQTRPRHGDVIYNEAERHAAELRALLAADFLRAEGITLTTEVGDEDAYHATLDAVASFAPDEILVSTLPGTRSGWLRRDLVERIRDAVDVPVEHIVTDLDQDGLAVHVTLVVANRTVDGEELHETLKAQAERDDNRVFIVVVPQEGGDGSAALAARRRLTHLVGRLRDEGLLASGMIGDPDPYTATLNALELFTVDEVVISTLPRERSGWLRNDLVGRVKGATQAHVEHVVVETESVTV